MAQSVNVNFRMDEQLKKNVEDICQRMGMTLTTALTICCSVDSFGCSLIDLLPITVILPGISVPQYSSSHVSLPRSNRVLPEAACLH